MLAHYHSSAEGYDQDRQGGGGKRMKKRGASEYITKDHGSLDNRDAAPDPPKMSTAAQMARRKIATPKSRTGRSTTPTLPSNPFASQQQSTSFQFGSNANQSFPPSTANQAFQFNVPSTSSSFTFGQTQNEQPQQHSLNPFTSLNGAATVQGGDQIVNTEMHDTSPEQQKSVQPAQSSIFSFPASQPTSSAPANGFSFGQPTTQQPNGGFGGGLFGQQNSQPQPSKIGLFGQPSTTQQNGFTPSFGQRSQSPVPSKFDQSTTTTTSAPALSGFGTSTTPSATSPSIFNFAQTPGSAAPQTQSDTAPAQPNRLFDFGNKQSDSPSASKSPSFSFGQVAGASAQSSDQNLPKPTFAGFAQTSGSQQVAKTSVPSVFSGFGASTKQVESSVQQDTPSSGAPSMIFKEPQGTSTLGDSSETQQNSSNPFASLFSPARAASDASSEGIKPVKFNFGQSTSFPHAPSSSNTSTSPFSKSTHQPAPLTNSTDQVKDQPTDLSSDKNRANNMFGSNSTSSTSPGGLFNLNQPANSQNEIAGTATKSVFGGFTPQMPATPTSAPSPSIFKFGNKSTTSSESGQHPEAIVANSSPQKPALFQGGSTPAKMAEAALGSFAKFAPAPASPASNDRTHLQEKTSVSTATDSAPIDRAVSTEGPPQVPRYLSGDKYKKYDENWRLKALNRQLKDALMNLDPATHDFINIVQNYLDHRESIGEGLEGYERKKLAGSKRKAIDVDDLQENSETSKRAKPSGDAVITQEPAKNDNNVFANNATMTPFAGFTPSKTAADTNTSNIFRSMIPGAVGSGVATPTSVAGPQKSTTPPSSPPKASAPQMPKFEVPKFGSGSGANFLGAFAKSSAENAKKFEQAAKEKRKAEEFDSDEDDEEQWNKKYEEEQKAKKAKIEAAAKSALAVPSFIPSASSSRSNSPFAWAQPVKSIEVHDSKSPEPSSQTGAGSSQSNAIDVETGDESSSQESGNSGDDEEDHAEDDEGHEENEDEDDDEAEEIPDIPHKDSLFSRITGKSPSNKSDQPIMQPAANNTFKPSVMFGNIGQSTPEQPAFSPITPSTVNTGAMPKGDFVPTTKFNFTAAPASSSSQVFGSTFLGGTLKDGPIPGEGLFGSRPSTPSNSDANKTSGLFGASISKPADNTYKQGTPIKFGASTSDSHAPSVEVTAATPPGRETPKPFTSVFGQSSTPTNTASDASLGFTFGASTSGSQPAPGFLSAAPHLGGISGPSSRATSPGMVSEAESVATDNTEDYSQEPQTSLMQSNSGEENDILLYEAKAAISRMYKEEELPEKTKLQKGWNKVGSGVMKVLKDKTSGKTRILFRAEPSAAVILNTRLLAKAEYRTSAAGKNGTITFPVATEEGMQMWMIKVKTIESAKEAAKVMNAHKGD